MPPENQHREPQRPAPRSYPDLDRIRWEPLYPPEQDTNLHRERPISGHRFNLSGVVAVLHLCLALAILAAFFLQICAFFSMIGKLAEHPTKDEAFLGMAAFGLSIVSILAVLRIVLAAQNNRR